MEAFESVVTALILEKTIVQCSEDNLPVVISLRRQLSTASLLEKTIFHCSEDNFTVLNLWWKLLFLEKTISQCFSFWEDNLTSAQEDNFTREDNFTISLLMYFYQLICIPYFVFFYLLFIYPLFYLPVNNYLYFLFFKDFMLVPLKSKSNFLASIEGYVHTYILKLRCELMTRKTNWRMKRVLFVSQSPSVCNMAAIDSIENIF